MVLLLERRLCAKANALTMGGRRIVDGDLPEPNKVETMTDFLIPHIQDYPGLS